MMMKYFKLPSVLTLLFCFQGCELGYYSHLAKGQYELMQNRKSSTQVIASQTTDSTLKDRLLLTQKALNFAQHHLKINVEKRYSYYVDLGRPYVVWSLSAAPALSFEAYQWCYPIVGCAHYRGFFDYERARQAEQQLQKKGYETYLRGVTAYSTLGWFSDPVMNTFINYSEKEYLTLIFHELAHSQLYIKNDTQFNESFATFVGEEAYQEFKTEFNLTDPLIDQIRKESYEDLKRLVIKYKKQLQALYESEASNNSKRSEKRHILSALQQEYDDLKMSWSHSGYDQWITSLNNARFMVYSDYESQTPMFEALFNECNKDWTCFYDKAQALTKNRE